MVELTDELATAYADQADDVGDSLASFIGERLRCCLQHTSSSGLYVDDAARQELGRYLNSSLVDVGDLLRAVRGLVTIRIKVADGVVLSEVPIELQVDKQVIQNLQPSVHSGWSLEQRIKQFALAGLKNPH